MPDIIAELGDRRRAGTLRADEDHHAENVPFAPLGEAEIRAAEASLGFSLPSTLRRVYAEVGNGGFGPAYGIMGLTGGKLDDLGRDAVSLFRRFREPDARDPMWRWPERLLPVCHLGCAMHLCVDCSAAAGPVVWFEPNVHGNRGDPWEDSFYVLAASTEEWLSAWASGNDLLARLCAGAERES